jgi:hypothetical protein
VADHVMVVMSNVEAGREDEFNDWYTNEHIGDVVQKLPGFVSAQRFELAPTQLEPTTYRYMTIYRIPEGRLEEAQASILYQRVERAQALAAGRRPLLTVSDTMSEPHFSWFFTALTDELTSDKEREPLPELP